VTYGAECAKPFFKFCDQVVVRAEVTVSGTAVAASIGAFPTP
jgi:hypothetical protein